MNNDPAFFSMFNTQLNVVALHVSDTGPTAYSTFGEEKPSYTVIGFDKKPDVYKFPRASFIDTVAVDSQNNVHTRFYSPEKFLRMAMNSAVGALEIVSSPKQVTISDCGYLLQQAVAHYFNPSLMWESVTGTMIGMTNIKGEDADITARRAVHLVRLYMIRVMLEDGIIPTSLSTGAYMENHSDAPSFEKFRRVYEWAIIDGMLEQGLCPELYFEALRVQNPVPNVHPLQKNRPGFSDFANATLEKFMAAL